MKYRYLVPIAATSLLLTAACGSTSTQAKATGTTTGGPGGSTASTGPSNGSGKSLNVWLMTGEITNKTLATVDAAFHAQHPGVKVNVAIQQWSGIAAKLTSALGSNSPPDAMEIGNTDVPEFAASGGLENLEPMESSLPNSTSWLTGLSAPATVNGKLYGVPLLAGDRVVIYNKSMFSKAGITAVPTSRAQLVADGKKLMTANAATKDFSALYWPGKYWYAALSLLWDDGGSIAKYTSGKWSGMLDTAASLRGLRAFKTIQNSLSSVASRGVNTSNPDQDAVLASGKAAMIIGGGWEVAAIEKDNPALKGNLGVFAFPSKTPGKEAPVFLGGSDIAIPKNARHRSLALAWVKDLTGTAGQTAMYNNDGLLPNSTTLLGLAAGNPIQSVFLSAARSSKGTPASPGWATVENDNVMETLFSSVAQGTKSVASVAKSTDRQLNKLLNQGS